MTYEIIARKYRPHNFDQIIGQEKLLLMLKHTIEKNRVGQSYLFSGPRGVGKTTLARILVKCLNCDKGIVTIPCDECDSCQGIQNGVSLDYEEIDGASNRGIDQIREIKSNLAFASPQGKHRVFVIDEVHMLTIEAFNALLKTLEEPPPKMIFILCTTEKHKIPITIRSRCQQFQFDRVEAHLIEKHLKKILDLENISYEEKSLFPIAKKSDGSVRDAENLLEQAIAYAGEILTHDKVTDILGELSSEKKFEFIENLIHQRLKENQFLIHRFSVEGIDFEQFLFSLNEIFSATIYLKSGIDDPSLLEIYKEDWEAISKLAEKFILQELFLLIDMIYEFIKELKNTTFERLSIYYFLIKLHRYPSLISNEELKENITHLAKYYLQPDETIRPLTDIPSESPKVSEAGLEFNSEVGVEMNVESSDQKSDSIIASKETDSIPITQEPQTEGVLDITKEMFSRFVDSFKDSDLAFYRLLLNFDLEEIKKQSLILYNRENVDEVKLINQKKKLLDAFNGLLRQLKISSFVKDLEIKENVFDHNVKVIEEVLKSNLTQFKNE